MDREEFQELATDILSWINWHKEENHVEGMSQKEILDSIESKVHNALKDKLDNKSWG